MRTAQDYLDGMDKEAAGSLAYKAFQGVTNLFGAKAGVIAGKTVARGTKFSNNAYKKYKGTAIAKKYGDKPLVAGGVAAGAAAGHVATGGQPLAFRPRTQESRNIRI